MFDIAVWLDSSVTTLVREKIQAEIKYTKDVMFETPGISQSPDIQRDYMKAYGYVKGLEFIESTIKAMEESVNDERTSKTVPR